MNVKPLTDFQSENRIDLNSMRMNGIIFNIV